MSFFLVRFFLLIFLVFFSFFVENLWSENDQNSTTNIDIATQSVVTNDDMDQRTNVNPIVTNSNNTNDLFNPFSTIFIFSINSGINLFVLDKEETINKYNLDQLNNTLSISFHVKLGVVLQRYWMLLLNYGYSKREDYQYKENYFSLNSRSLESRYHHHLQLDLDYFLWNYLEDKNISFGMGVGWLRKNIIFSTIGDVLSRKDILSSRKVLKYDAFIITPKTKLYYRLGENGTVYFAINYNFIVPRFEHYPEFLLGIDVNLDMTPTQQDNSNPFFKDKIEPTKPEDRKPPPQTSPGGGAKKEVQENTKEIYKTIRQDK